ncbi:MAG TPA: hypothetical protein VLG38_04335 [Gammaproteobacteria bacterium]|nr:hypothetical protein [Gammaproteobacteria bacterium]
MSTFRIKSVNTYKRCTPVQLAGTIRQLQRQFITASKTPDWKVVRGKSATQQCNAISREIRKVATILRSKTVQQINMKIRALKTQQAKNLGVRTSSPKASSTAVKRLKVKIRQINKCNRVSPLIKLCTGVKLSTFKNPVVRNKSRRTTTATRRRTGTRSRRTTRARKTTRRSGAAHIYKRQARSLKKQVHQLKRRNSFMRRLVNQFRRKVATLKRSYRAAHAKPRWKVYHGKGTSNVVRFNRSTTYRQAQRRAS